MAKALIWSRSWFDMLTTNGSGYRGISFVAMYNTGTGMSLSYCDRIFFVGHGSLWLDKNELHHVLHEVEHLGQCQQRGKRTYLAEYILKVGVDIAKTGRVNVHDVHDFEVAAEAKANQLTDILWNKIQSRSVPIPAGVLNQPTYPQPQPMPGPVQQNGSACVTQNGSCQWFGPVGWSCMCAIGGVLYSGVIR